MNEPERFQRLKTWFGECVDLADAARDARVAAFAAEDPALAGELRALLGALDRRDLAPSATPPATRRFGPFETVRRLGSGGMGEVFLARRVDGGFAQQVALKLVRYGGLSAEMTRRFVRERQILARLAHPGIARLIDGGVAADGQPWLAMEYVDGKRLDAWCARGGTTVRARVALFRQVCAAVAFAHGNLVVHRDLKPANVIIGADGAPRLLDFGIAKLLDDDSDADATRTGQRVLTPRYAAPEQIVGDATTTATDVYTLGVLLFELLTGRTPYASAEAGHETWTRAVLNEAPRALVDAMPPTGEAWRRRELRGDLDRIVRHAMAKRPADRYASVAALSDDLADWQSGHPLRSGIGSAREQTRALLRRYRWPLASALAIALALAIGLFIAWQQAREAARQAATARGNLAALLDVLDGAVPTQFAGREPTAAALLTGAADALRRDHAGDDALLRPALTRIGLALLNMGHPRAAERALGASLQAQMRLDPDDTATVLDLLKLLALAQSEPDARPRARLTAHAIAGYAQRPDAAAGDAIDALGSAAGALSRWGDFDEAQALVSLGEARLARGAAVSRDDAENFWRQAGWMAWRRHDVPAARAALARAATIMADAPGAFMPLRVAEAQASLAEIAIAAGDAPAAARHLAAALPAHEKAYPVDHDERARLAVITARLALLQGDAARARVIAQRARATVDANATSPRLLAEARRTEIQTLAAAGHCDDARAGLATLRAPVAGQGDDGTPRAIADHAATVAAVDHCR